MDYLCTNGHDLCKEMYPGPHCPYCEKLECRHSHVRRKKGQWYCMGCGELVEFFKKKE